jgi:hypothetical protein
MIRDSGSDWRYSLGDCKAGMRRQSDFPFDQPLVSRMHSVRIFQASATKKFHSST